MRKIIVIISVLGGYNPKVKSIMYLIHIGYQMIVSVNKKIRQNETSNYFCSKDYVKILKDAITVANYTAIS